MIDLVVDAAAAFLYDPDAMPRGSTRWSSVAHWLAGERVPHLLMRLFRTLAGPEGPAPENADPYRPYPQDVLRLTTALAAFSAARSASTVPVPVRFRAPGERPRFLVVTAFRPPYPLGSDTIMLYAADITESEEEHAQLATERVWLSTLLDSLDAGILFTDGAFHALHINRRAMDWLGLPFPSPPSGIDVAALVRTVSDRLIDPVGFHSLVDASRTGDRAEFRDLRFKDGSIRRMYFRPVYGRTERLGNLWMFENVTDRLAVERALTDRADALAELADQRARFTSAVSHALRTPLTSIAGFAELLSAAEPGQLPTEEQQFAGGIQRNTALMQSLIEDLLLVSGLDTRILPLRIEPMVMSALLASAAEEVRGTADLKGVRVEHLAPPRLQIRGDRDRLRRALVSILEKAVRSVGEGSPVTVRAEVDTGGSAWIISVRGVGRPVSEAELGDLALGRLLDPSTGAADVLGLAVARAVAEAHGGGLEVVRSEEDGITVLLRLPRGLKGPQPQGPDVP
ncbi:PAS domain-containing sensor histidine kinase [Streptomyces beijiangensis]|uniref:Sensor-like histidine kinase SenX3 n=1 Tax=Streptomyces beijiangensis TaxID=163361 RepID=A0A939F9D1_9ACTN|nr:PAS domain-containing sensor histidine kinase [Streptomyces beijiangensis]MBO0514462.1 PAS domain-containing sensor histidine kinase [Streptomyces beijiangensis]